MRRVLPDRRGCAAGLVLHPWGSEEIRLIQRGSRGVPRRKSAGGGDPRAPASHGSRSDRAVCGAADRGNHARAPTGAVRAVIPLGGPGAGRRRPAWRRPAADSECHGRIRAAARNRLRLASPRAALSRRGAEARGARREAAPESRSPRGAAPGLEGSRGPAGRRHRGRCRTGVRGPRRGYPEGVKKRAPGFELALNGHARAPSM